MKSFTTVLLASLVGFSIASSGKGPDGAKRRDEMTEDQRTCRKMYNINRAQRIVANTTRIEQIAKLDAGRAERIREVASKDGPELARLQQNKTLVAYCDVYRSHEQTVRTCFHIKNLEKMERRMKDNSLINDTAKRNHEPLEQVRRRWQHDIDIANKQKNNKTMLAECEKIKNAKPANGNGNGNGKGSDEIGKQKSAATALGSSLFAVVLAGVVAGLVV